jgi:hypothetical protein
MGDPQSLNLYAYMMNNPLAGVDADGHGDRERGKPQPSEQPGGQDTLQQCSGADQGAGLCHAGEISVQGTGQQQNDGTPSVIVHGGGHWWNKIGSWFSGHAAAAGIAFARFGRLGGPAHRAAIGRISRLLEESGYSVTQEKYIPTPNGAKGYRFSDVYGKNDSTGEVRMYQVGRTNANGSPVSREVQAMDDIQGATGLRPQFIDYNNPVVTGEVPVIPTSDTPTPGAGEIPEGESPIEEP